MKTALVVGASGLVGSYVLDQLLADASITEVRTLTRKVWAKTHPKLQQIVTDFDKINELALEIFTVDAAFSCLGTTWKRTGDIDQYRKIEVDYPIAIAERVLAAGGQSFHYVSAVGSSSSSWLSYSRMKGEAENGLKALQSRFRTTCVASYRPSFILGPRQEKRLIEELAIPIWNSLDMFMRGPLRRYKGVHAEVIAKTMIKKDTFSRG